MRDSSSKDEEAARRYLKIGAIENRQDIVEEKTARELLKGRAVDDRPHCPRRGEKAGDTEQKKGWKGS